MATHLFSPTTSIQLLAGELRSRLHNLGGQSVGVHLPGVLNHYADAPSRAGERLYASLSLHVGFLQWIESMFPSRHVLQVIGVKCDRVLLAPHRCPVSIAGIVLHVPPPHLRISMVKSALDMAICHTNSLVLLVLPTASYADERWQPYMSQLHKVHDVPSDLRLYSQRATAYDESWCEPIVVETRPKGRWEIWQARASHVCRT